MNKATVDLIKHFESLHDGDLHKIGLQPKMDSVGIYTEGWGRAMIDPTTKKFIKGIANADKAIKYQTIFTIADADKALEDDLKTYSTFALNKLGNIVWDKLNDNQQGAVTSFVYNCGIGKPPYKLWTNIPLYINKGMSKDSLIAYWKKSVIKGGGKILKGLVLRRAAEATFFFS